MSYRLVYTQRAIKDIQELEQAVKSRIGRENTMITREILANALKLKPQERLELADLLLESLDRPDRTIEEVWSEEARRRLEAYRAGRMASVPFEKVFDE